MVGSLSPATTKTSAANTKHDGTDAEAAKRTEKERQACKFARAAALARAVKAEEETAAVVQERDTAAARLRDALARAAEEPKGAPPDSEKDAAADASAISDQAPNDAHQVMLLHEADAVLNLHA